MARFQSHFTRRNLFRSQHDKVLGGVLGGFAQHFDVNSFWIRLGFVILTFLQPEILILYLICFFIMPKAGVSSRQDSHAFKGHGTNPHNQSQGFNEKLNLNIDNTMEHLERKVRQLEDLVTDKEFMLRQQFKNL